MSKLPISKSLLKKRARAFQDAMNAYANPSFTVKADALNKLTRSHLELVIATLFHEMGKGAAIAFANKLQDEIEAAARTNIRKTTDHVRNGAH